MARLHRGTGRRAAARARVRRPALGRRGSTRLRRPPRRLGERSPSAGCRHGAARTADAAIGLERRQAERDHPFSRAAHARRNQSPRSRPARARRAPCRDPGGTAGAGGGQPPVRGRVRAPGGRRPRAGRAARDDSGADRREAGLAGDRGEGATPACGGGWQGLLGGRRRASRRHRARSSGATAPRAGPPRAHPARATCVDRRRNRVRVPPCACSRRRLRADPSRLAIRDAPARGGVDRAPRAARGQGRAARAPLSRRARARRCISPVDRRLRGPGARRLPCRRRPGVRLARVSGSTQLLRSSARGLERR